LITVFIVMGVRKGPERCVLCLRSEDEAVKEQVAKGVGCGTPKCVFAEVIQQAIEDFQKAEESRYCIRCGHAFQEGDRYCIICGEKRIK